MVLIVKKLEGWLLVFGTPTVHSAFVAWFAVKLQCHQLVLMVMGSRFIRSLRTSTKIRVGIEYMK